MEENDYILNILSGLGLAINEKNHCEIIINYPIKFNKKSMQYEMNSEYKIMMQPIGSFLSDFLNTDFNEYDDFLEFFSKYSLSLLNYSKLLRLFKDKKCDESKFKEFVNDLLSKNKNHYTKLQEQTDMILDYCYINPNKRAKNYKPIERLYVLRRIAPNLTLLNENKSAYYSVNLFSSYPGESEKEIYEFLAKKNNKVTEFDLILPYDISSIIYKSIGSILRQEVYLKVCKNCNRYFIAKNKSSNYCSNIAPNETKKTCKEIGRKNVFENSKNEDPIIFSYYQVYNRKAMMKSRYPDIQKYIEDFEKYSRIGKNKLAKYKNNKITAEEFKNWIKKNS